MKRLIALAAAVCLITPAAAAVSHLMRVADLSAAEVVFTYEGDLWLAPREGGAAHRVTRDPGVETYAKFDPRGEWLAFTGQYDGGQDVYVMPAAGGEPRRLTWHPAADRVLGWTPDGSSVLFRSRREYPFRGEEVYTVSLEGGLPRRLPVDRAGLASLSPDGARIAYNRISREDRTWKRHKGGTAQDLWVGSLELGDYRRVTEWPGTDNYPMWAGEWIYFTSDRRHGTLNLYRYRVADGAIEAMTDYADYDVKYPSLGPGAIVYQHGETLETCDLQTGEIRPLRVEIHSDRVELRSELVTADQLVRGFRPSPDGERVVFEARGEVLITDAKAGEARNISRASASREKNPAWSPDGKQIALISDRSGEEEIWVCAAEGATDCRRLTHDGDGYRTQPVWSPDSRYLLFSDRKLRLTLLEVASGEQRLIDQGEYDDAWERWGIQDYAFSPDSRLIAYSKLERSLNESIFLYSIEEEKTTRITGEFTEDWSPSFDPRGRYLYFLSQRSFRPIMGRVDQNHVFLDMTLPYVVLLSGDQPSPFDPDAERGSDEGGGKEEDDAVAVEIELRGIGERILPFEGVEPGNYFRLEAIEGGALFLSRKDKPFLKYQTVSDETSDALDLMRYRLDRRATEKMGEGISNYHLAAGGKKLAYKSGSEIGLAELGGEIDPEQGKIPLGEITFRLDPRAEFRQIFSEAWRVQRDWFYDPGMHGVDWDAVRRRYEPLIAECGNRADLNYLIGEMIGELNAGHTYVFGGALGEGGKQVEVGLLGVDWADSVAGAPPRIAKILPGLSWDPELRSPLRVPGCDARDGDYLVSVDGERVAKGSNPHSLFEGEVGRRVSIVLSARPDGSEPRTCRVRPVAGEQSLRYRQWVDHNRRLVEEKSGGRIGYLHIPDMMQRGLIEFARSFYPQYYKKALVIDERYNGGGFVGDMIIDRLERRLWSLTQPRQGGPIPDPERGFHGHLALLINADTGSNGEYFAQAIKQKKLAKVIGRRTWGGAVGIEPHQRLVDGGVTTPPQFAPFWFGGWLIEGHGVEPDIDVQNEPRAVLEGRDQQLEAAVDYLLGEIEKNPLPLPERPPFPRKAKPAGP